MSKIRLLIATDDRDLLVSLLIFLGEETNMCVVGMAVDRESMVVLVQSTHPDIVLVDETLLSDGMSDSVDPIQGVDPRPVLVMLAAQEGETVAMVAADVVVLKHVSPESLRDSLLGVQQTKSDRRSDTSKV